MNVDMQQAITGVQATDCPDRECILRDGRRLAYIELGDPNGLPCFLFHGIPGSRRCLTDEPVLHEFGVRLIAPDRPGMGLSDPHPARTLTSWADDVAQLADALGIGSFHVAGVSGGGPHALTCAVHLGHRVLSVTLICTAAPPELLGWGRGMARGNRIAFFLARYAPWVLGWSFRSYASAVAKHGPALLERVKKQLCAWDRMVLADGPNESKISDAYLMDMREAFRQGHQGVLADFLLAARPWKLDFTKLTMPVMVWHGEADTLVPVEPVRALVPLLPNCNAHFIPDAGHMLLESGSTGRSILQGILDTQA